MKFEDALVGDGAALSLPVRGAWIEMLIKRGTPPTSGVAPRKGSVD